MKIKNFAFDDKSLLKRKNHSEIRGTFLGYYYHQ